MRKYLICIGLISTLLLTNSLQAYAFSDVSPNYEYYPAVLFLRDLGAISGYTDGEFKPYRDVNRAEFLKILFESFHLKLPNRSDLFFEDVNREDWFFPYVMTALEYGYVTPNDFFRPSDPITRAEALVMIGRLKKWDIIPNLSDLAPYEDVDMKSYYGVYVSYAKANKITEPDALDFHPNDLLTRGYASQLIYRTYINKNTDILDFELKEPEEEYDFIPIDFQKYAFNTFDDVILSHPFPNTFYRHEVFYFSGSTVSNDETVFVFLRKEGAENDEIDYFVGKVKNGKFDVPVRFLEPGNFELGIVTGKSGKSKIIPITVINDLPVSRTVSTKGVFKPINIKIDYKDGRTKFSWDHMSDITKVVIFQGNVLETFFFRHPLNEYTVDFSDFYDFKENPTYMIVQSANIRSTFPLKIETGWHASDLFFFDAAKHYPVKVDLKKIAYSEIPEYYDDAKRIFLTARSASPILSKAGIIEPNGNIKKVDLTVSVPLEKYYDDMIVPANQRFSLAYSPDKPGTHIVSIYENTGDPIINVPIYFKSVPLVPTFFDLNVPKLSTSAIKLSTDREYLLNLINNTRASYGLKAFMLDSNLNNLAQAHADEMKKGEYLSHIGLNGSTPEDRKDKAKIQGYLSENLARAVTLDYAHEGLMLSALHRKNILNPDNLKIGIGLAKNDKGYIYIAEEYISLNGKAGDDANISDVNSELIKHVNNKRVALGLSLLQSDSALTNLADYWSRKMAASSFTSFNSADGEVLDDLIVEKKLLDSALNAFVFEGGSISSLKEHLELDTDILSNVDAERIGIGAIYSEKSGKYKVTLFYK